MNSRALLATVAVFAALLFIATVSAQQRGDVSPSHSLESPFIHDWWLEGVPHWDIGADAVVTADYVRLTPNLPSRYGYAWNTVPNEHKWWEATVVFNVRSRSSPGADGMAMWYVERPHKGRPGSIMGNTPDFHGLGIILDSYDNDNNRDNPAVAVLTSLDKEPSKWDPENDFMRTSIIRCQYDYRRASSGANEMIVTYHEKKLTVRLKTLMGSSYTNCGEAHDIELPANWFFGFTAVTGGVSDNHDVVSFLLRPTGSSVPSSASGQAFDHSNDQREKAFWATQDNPNDS